MPDAPDQVALQGTTSFTCCTTFLLSACHVHLSWCVSALLSQGDEVEQHVEVAVPSAAEAVLYRACTGGFDGSHASEYSDLRHTEAWARQADAGRRRRGSGSQELIEREHLGPYRRERSLRTALHAELVEDRPHV